MIDGFTIKNGSAVANPTTPNNSGGQGANGDDAFGGAVACFNGSSPTLSNLVIQDCVAQGRTGEDATFVYPGFPAPAAPADPAPAADQLPDPAPRDPNAPPDPNAPADPNAGMPGQPGAAGADGTPGAPARRAPTGTTAARAATASAARSTSTPTASP